MNANRQIAALEKRWKLRRIAMVTVSAATLCGLVGTGTGAAQAAVPIIPAPLTAAVILPATVPPGPCDPEEIGQEKAGLDGKMYVCVPIGPGGNLTAEGDEKADGKPSTEASAETQRLEQLASDPAQGGNITPGTMQEARTALGLEKTGQLPSPVRRDPTGAADFIDGRNVLWDVKNFNSNFPPSQGGYDLNDSMTRINRELQLGENIIVSTENLSAEATTELHGAVEDAGIGDRVLFWP